MVLLNGIETSQTSVSDRGLLYGQNVFETIAIRVGQPCLLDLHIARLIKGCKVLGIPLDLKKLNIELNAFLKSLKSQNDSKAVLRITVTMGEGGRGYLDPQTPAVNRILSFHNYPNHPSSNWLNGIVLGLSSVKLASQPLLAGIKHGNRLEQIMARRLWEPHWHEALLFDYRDNLIEATQSNVFIVKNGIIRTPLLTESGVAGVMREYVIQQAQCLGLEVKIMSLSLADVLSADEVFVSNSVIGIWPVRQFQTADFTDFNVTNSLLKSIINNEVIPNY